MCEGGASYVVLVEEFSVKNGMFIEIIRLLEVIHSSINPIVKQRPEYCDAILHMFWTFY